MSQDTLSKDTTHESTSAFFDDQPLDNELESWLNDEESVQRWHRYSLISSSLKGDLGQSPQLDISASVSEAVEQEASQRVVKAGFGSRSAAVRKAAARWVQPTGKVAVAAAVAVVAVMTVQTYQQPNTVPAAEEPALMTAPIGGRQPVSFSPNATSESMAERQFQDLQQRRQAQSYLIDHQQQVLMLQDAASTHEPDTNKKIEQETPEQ